LKNQIFRFDARILINRDAWRKKNLGVGAVFFSLRRFGHLSDSCIKTRRYSVSAYIFRHSDQNDLIVFGHLKIISVCDRKTKHRVGGNVSARQT